MTKKPDNVILSPTIKYDENNKPVAAIQSYPDKPDETFSVGDNTTNGNILAFKHTGNASKGDDILWYAVTDKPSEWQIKSGMNTGWNWLWLLSKR